MAGRRGNFEGHALLLTRGIDAANAVEYDDKIYFRAQLCRCIVRRNSLHLMPKFVRLAHAASTLT